MSVLWTIPQREVMLRGNLSPATAGATQSTNYSAAAPGDSAEADRAIQFPELSVNDVLLDAGGTIVELIGLDPQSPYRKYFADVTASIASGATIPTVSTTSKPVIGVIGDVRNASSPNQRLNFADERVVKGYNTLSTNILKVNPYLYYTDNARIWHTITNVIADVVIWSRNDQITLMGTTPRGACPFSEDLIGLLVDGALAKLFRNQFNMEQAPIYEGKWQTGLGRTFGEPAVAQLRTREITE